MSVIRGKVLATEDELWQFASLWFDESDNKDQIITMLKEGAEGGYSGYQLFKDLHGDDKWKAAVDIFSELLNRAKVNLIKYSDETTPTA